MAAALRPTCGPIAGRCRHSVYTRQPLVTPCGTHILRHRVHLEQASSSSAAAAAASATPPLELPTLLSNLRRALRTADVPPEVQPLGLEQPLLCLMSCMSCMSGILPMHASRPSMQARTYACTHIQLRTAPPPFSVYSVRTCAPPVCPSAVKFHHPHSRTLRRQRVPGEKASPHQHPY